MSDYISQTITVSSCQSDISNQCRIKTPCITGMAEKQRGRGAGGGGGSTGGPPPLTPRTPGGVGAHCSARWLAVWDLAGLRITTATSDGMAAPVGLWQPMACLTVTLWTRRKLLQGVGGGGDGGPCPKPPPSLSAAPGGGGVDPNICGSK